MLFDLQHRFLFDRDTVVYPLVIVDGGGILLALVVFCNINLE